MRLSKLVFVATTIAVAVSSAAAAVTASYSIGYLSDTTITENGTMFTVPPGKAKEIMDKFADRDMTTPVTVDIVGTAPVGVAGGLVLHDGYTLTATVVATPGVAGSNRLTLTLAKPPSVLAPSHTPKIQLAGIAIGLNDITIAAPPAGGFSKVTVPNANAFKEVLQDGGFAAFSYTGGAPFTFHVTAGTPATADYHGCLQVTDAGDEGRLVCVRYTHATPALYITVQNPRSPTTLEYLGETLAGPIVLACVTIPTTYLTALAFSAIDEPAYELGLQDSLLPNWLKRWLPGGERIMVEDAYYRTGDEDEDGTYEIRIDPSTNRQVRVRRPGATAGETDDSSGTEGETTDALGVPSLIVPLVTLPFLLLL